MPDAAGSGGACHHGGLDHGAGVVNLCGKAEADACSTRKEDNN